MDIVNLDDEALLRAYLIEAAENDEKEDRYGDGYERVPGDDVENPQDDGNAHIRNVFRKWQINQRPLFPDLIFTDKGVVERENE